MSDEPPQRMRLAIRAETGRPYVAHLRKYLPLAWKLVPDSPTEISVALVGNEKMGKLHEQFLGVAGPTDVLTFELDHGPNGRCEAGEIIVCVPVARERAQQHGVAVSDELLLYTLHGLLHLSGFDDRTTKAFDIMHRTEDQILTRLGIGHVFQTQPSAGAPRPARAGKTKSTGARR